MKTNFATTCYAATLVSFNFPAFIFIVKIEDNNGRFIPIIN